MKITMLTTEDNPFDPFDQWDAWHAWDTSHGYHTSGLLARIATTSDDLSEIDQARAIRLAMDEIVSLNVSGMHKLVHREIDDTAPAA